MYIVYIVYIVYISVDVYLVELGDDWLDDVLHLLLLGLQLLRVSVRVLLQPCDLLSSSFLASTLDFSLESSSANVDHPLDVLVR